MFTSLIVGCGLLVFVGVVAIVFFLFVLGLSEEPAVQDSAVDASTGQYEAEADVELVDLLIDGGCHYGEYFTEEDEACTLAIDCEEPAECITFGDNLVTTLQETYGSLTAEESVATDEETTVLTHYTVDLELELLLTDDDISDAKHTYDSSLWYSFAWLIPEHARPDMTQFEVFESGETLAYVYLHDDYGVEWTLGMNRENIELASETMVTYIHEFAHLVSLRNTEINYYVYEDECETLYIEDSCFYNDAYLADFYHQFYADDTYDYTSDYFVSDYAMSSMTEDFAESFAHFILSPQPAGHTVAEQKLLFFYDYEYFVYLRAEILGRVATWLKRTVEL